MSAVVRAAAVRHAPPDDALFAQLADGELSPLGELFDRYHANVRHFLLSLPVDPAGVDDLVQETFLTASRAASNFRPGAARRPFLFGIAAKLAWRRRRSFARLRRMLLSFGEQPKSATPSALDEIECDERRAAVRAALDRLSERHRTVLVMVELGEMTGVEAAAALDLPAGTVWRRLSEARAEVARHLCAANAAARRSPT